MLIYKQGSATQFSGVKYKIYLQSLTEFFNTEEHI